MFLVDVLICDFRISNFFLRHRTNESKSVSMTNCNDTRVLLDWAKLNQTTYYSMARE